MAILSNLEPKRVFEIFEEMCAIPHGSTNTKAISDWDAWRLAKSWGWSIIRTKPTT